LDDGWKGFSVGIQQDLSQMWKFWSDIRGNLLVTFALVAPVLLGAIAVAVDYTSWTGQSRKLQAIADIAALTAAKEMYLANANTAQIRSVADAVAQAQLNVGGSATASPLKVAAQVISNGEAVEVEVSQSRNSYFADAVVNNLTPLSAKAVARPLGGGRLCVLTLDENVSTALMMKQEALITAPTCAVYSNADSSSGIDVINKAEMTAELICSAGGVDGVSSAYSPPATTDCPLMPDPLADRPAPSVGGCDYNDFKLKNGGDDDDEGGAVSLYPGVYCGGMDISNGDIFLEPGIYVIKDGELKISSNAMVTGENVGFYFTGNKAVFDFGSNTIVDLTAPRDGPMAGILFFEDRNAPSGRSHEITSNKAQVLLGTLYLSRGELLVNSNAPVAENSAWTAVIVNTLSVHSKSNLVLNTGYDQTDIPVPSGVNRAGSTIVLER
jgi:Flp pilus assembly protein TadG